MSYLLEAKADAAKLETNKAGRAGFGFGFGFWDLERLFCMSKLTAVGSSNFGLVCFGFGSEHQSNDHTHTRVDNSCSALPFSFSFCLRYGFGHLVLVFSLPSFWT